MPSMSEKAQETREPSMHNNVILGTCSVQVFNPNVMYT